MKKTEKTCPHCQKPIFGRSDKKYCDAFCKNAYGNTVRNQDEPLYYRIDRQLKTNRRILSKYNRRGKTIIEKSIMMEEGFDPNFFTHYWKNKKGQVYLCCFEYGFLQLDELDKTVYLLEHWLELKQQKNHLNIQP